MNRDNKNIFGFAQKLRQKRGKADINSKFFILNSKLFFNKFLPFNEEFRI